MSSRSGNMAPANKTYVAHVSTAQTGISRPEAEKRITGSIAEAKQTAAKGEQTAR
ncbi:hypothetical protein AB4Z10_09125 [Bosea sp. RAF48]|jgi:hypothetical protein|uniref:hypothetical protein n=1 Tax=Bosea sp. RAF48 TaxID=3237480 RepID=UPI003F92D7A0